MLVIGTITADQIQGTAETTLSVEKLLDYYSTKPDQKLLYHAKGMILLIHRDAFSLSELKYIGHNGGNFFLGSKDLYNTQETNGSVLTLSNTMKNTMSYETEE